jgi:hypothetical protein
MNAYITPADGGLAVDTGRNVAHAASRDDLAVGAGLTVG